MSDPHSKTENITSLCSAVNDLKEKQEKMDSRLRSVEIGQAETVIYCKNIMEKQEDEILNAKSFRANTEHHREELKTEISNLTTAITVQSTQAKTRWDILGKPLSAGVIGGVITMGAKALLDYMKHMKILFILPFLLCSCANVSSTRFTFKSENSTLIVEMPKEVEAKHIRIQFNAQQGTFEITSETWSSRNQDTILSQASREKAVLESGATLIEKAAEGAVRGAMKGAVPIP